MAQQAIQKKKVCESNNSTPNVNFDQLDIALETMTKTMSNLTSY